MEPTEKNFADWEGCAFGFGYGTGEEHTLRALKGFFDQIGIDPERPRAYDYERLEEALGPQVAWLIINALCRHGVGVIEYGTSPRYGWLTTEGEALKKFVDARTVAELEEICSSRSHDACYPDACNCGPDGYEKGRVCPNPFWRRR